MEATTLIHFVIIIPRITEVSYLLFVKITTKLYTTLTRTSIVKSLLTSP